MSRYRLSNNISALHELNYKPRDDVRLFIKRDDTLDFAMGGNKVRLAEYIADEIVESRCEKVLSFGSAFSNYVRVIAATCQRLGKPCDLIILHDEPIKDLIDFPNLYIASYYHKANLVFCKNEEVHDFIDEYLEQEDKQQIPYYWIPGGGHTKEAVYGYFEAPKEIKQQADEIGVEFGAIFLPCGTGTSQTGLIFGFHGSYSRIMGVTVARPVERCKAVIKSLVENVKECTNIEMDINDEEIIVLDNGKFGYWGGYYRRTA